MRISDLFRSLALIFAKEVYLFWSISPNRFQEGQIQYCGGYTADCSPGFYKLTRYEEKDGAYLWYGKKVSW